ncbi:integration host factor, alpha subunit, partial [Vibrio cholerae O1 str. EC-0012]
RPGQKLKARVENIKVEK